VTKKVLNALVHRSYMGAMTQIRVYDDKLNVWNAGELPKEISIEQLMKAHPSIPRNPLIADVCYLAGYIDTWGRGIQKIVSACRESGLNEPQFEDVFGGLRVTLTGGRSKATLKTAAKTGSEKSSETVSAEMSGKMSGKVSGKMSGKVLQLLLQNPQLSIPELAAAMGKTTRTVERIIRLLREEGHLKRIGPAKGGYWQVITNDED
jgi:ATP-dependent DNA helicase RecG